MSENPGGNPPSDDEPAAPEPQQPVPPVEPPAAPPPPPPPPAPPVSPAGPPVAPPAPPAPQYGQPAPGSYPPPAPQYGQPAPGPYPPAGGYPPPAPVYGAPGGQVSVGEAFNYGWLKFTQNIGPIVLVVLGFLLVGILISIVWNLILGVIGLGVRGGETTIDDAGNVDFNPGPGFFGLLLFGALFSIVVALIYYVLQAAIIRGALDITVGRAIEIRSMVANLDYVKVILASLLVAVLVGVGYLLCYIPGLIVAFFAQFTLFFVVDKGLGPVDALKASFSLINKNLGTMVVFFLATILVTFIGALLCGVGLLVAIPVVIIAEAFLYRRLLGEQVAA